MVAKKPEKKTRVNWTEREWEALAEWWLDHVGPGDNVRPRDGYAAALKAAQTAKLPPERHRPTQAVALVSLKPLFTVMHNVIARRKAEAEAAVKEQVEVPPVEEAVAVIQQPNDVDKLLTGRPTLEDVAREFARSLARLMVDAFTEEMQAQLPDIDISKLAPRKRLPRVLVVGCNAAQQQQLVASIGNLLDLRFAAGKARDQGIKHKAPTCDYAVLWVNWTDHSDREMLESVLNKQRIGRIEGKFSHLKEFVENVALKLVA